MAIQLLALELVLGALLIGGLAAYGKSIAERICLFVAVPLSFFVSYLLARMGVWDFLGSAVGSLVLSSPDIAEMIGGSSATVTGLYAIIIGIVRPLLVVPVFWALMLLLRIVIAIVFHKKNKELRLAARAEKKAIKAAKRAMRAAKKNGAEENVEMPERAPVGRKLVSAAIGAVACLVGCLLSFLPITFFANLAAPAIEKAETEAYAGTYVQETVKTVDESVLARFDGTAYTYASRFTGVHAILVAASSSLTDVSLTGNDGEVIAFNVTELIQHLLCDGVDAMAVYEYTYSPDVYTVGDLRPIGNILSDIAHTPALLKIGAELLEQTDLLGGEAAEEETEEGGLLDGFLTILLDSYHSDDTTALATDLDALSALVDLLSEELGECHLESEELLPAVIGFISKDENAASFIDVLADMSSYTEAVAILSEYGIDMLCGFLEISEDKDAFYEDFRAALLTAVNDRTVGEYEYDEVETFITSAASDGINVATYTVKNPDRLTSLDVAFHHYERYIARALEVDGIFSDFRLAYTGAHWFLSSDGDVYYLEKKDASTVYWHKADGDTALSAASLFSSVLVARSTEIFADDVTAEISMETLLSWCETVEIAIRAAYPEATDAMITEARTLANAVMSIEGFSPDTVFRSDVFDAVKTDLPASAAQNEAFGAVLATAGQLFTGLLGDEDISLDAVVDSFGLVGRLLDRLHALDITADVPAVMLRALSENKNFSGYIATETVPELIENMNKGLSTYEELFSTIQGYYGMAGGLLDL